MARDGITYEAAPETVTGTVGVREWRQSGGETKKATALGLLDNIHETATDLGAKHVWVGALEFEDDTAVTTVWYMR